MKLNREYIYFNSTLITYINDLLRDLDDFDEDRFNYWLYENHIGAKQNPSAYVKSCFKKELDRGTFTKLEEPEIKYLPEIQCFINQLRAVGIEIIPKDTLQMEITFSYLIDNKILTQEELISLNRSIVDYMVNTKKKQSTNNFLDLMRKSKTLKDKVIDWEEIDNEFQKADREWNELLEQL